MEWSEAYNVHKLRAGAVMLIVAWGTGGYDVSVCGYPSKAHIKKPVRDLDEAKAAAVKLARSFLENSLKELE